MLRKALSSQLLVFALGSIIFLVAAFMGWEKLHYGFNFIDEGYHMVESWRLTAGDHFIRDGLTDVLLLYTLINAMIFKLNPDITLLGFRKIEFILAVFSIMIFSLSLSRVNKNYWYFPLIFSIYAFTGFDPTGMLSNLNYYTYPHMFLVLHLALFLFGLHAKSVVKRRILFFFSGLFIWLISLTALHLTPVIISPFITVLFMKYFNKTSSSIDINDLYFTIFPFFLCWTIFLCLFNKPYVYSVLDSVRFFSTTHWTFTQINIEALKHIGVTAVFLSLIYGGYRAFGTLKFIIMSFISSIFMFFVIDTSFFGIIPPYYENWFSRPMWFASFIITLMIIMWGRVGKDLVNKVQLNNTWITVVILLVPSTILFLIISIFSTNGAMTAVQVSIPIVAAAAIALIGSKMVKNMSYLMQLAILLALLGPFYYETAWADWRFTFFDVPPDQAVVRLEKGFGEGIYTNPFYKRLYEWVQVSSQVHSNKDDFIISFVNSPMVYMIAHRRPALDHTFTDFSSRPREYYKRSIEKMVLSKRYPKLIYVFEGIPAIYPIDLKRKEFRIFGKQASFMQNDPISEYVQINTTLIDEFKIFNDSAVKLYIDNLTLIELMLKKDPNDPLFYYRAAEVCMRRSDLDRADVFFQKAINLNPSFIGAIHGQAALYVLRNENERALVNFKKIIALKPEESDAYYNIACIYARMNNIDDAVKWLEKAVEKGFNNWRLIENDKDLVNIRSTRYYMDLMRIFDRNE